MMPGDAELLADLRATVAGHGLVMLGACHDGETTRVMIGNAGSAMVAHVPGMPDADPADDPVNRWTRDVMTPIAASLGAEVVFPFDGPPWHPFVSWMTATGQAFISPLGLAIHPEFGLWFALRAALLFPTRLPLAQAEARSPCLTCVDRPCLSTCPVSAFDGETYAADACRDHLATPRGTDCMSQGCRARRACPVGTAWRYHPAHANFHMRAFAD